MTIFEGKDNPRELKFEAFTDEQNDLHPLIEKNPSIILPEELKSTKFAIFHELELKSGRIDFLYIFENGTILIAEVKLSRNQEIKRTVVAQLLDYASDLRQMTPKQLIGVLNGQSRKPRDIIFDEAFEKKLARGLRNKIIMEIVTDNNVEDLNRIFGFIGGGMTNVSVCLADVRKYNDAGKYYLEVNIRYPESSSTSDIVKISVDEFVDELAKKYKNEAIEVRNAMERLPAGWKLSYGPDVIIIYKPTTNDNMVLGLNFNQKYQWITLWAKATDYLRIAECFKGEDICENQPDAKKHFVTVRFPWRGITSAKIIDIMNKLDKL